MISSRNREVPQKQVSWMAEQATFKTLYPSNRKARVSFISKPIIVIEDYFRSIETSWDVRATNLPSMPTRKWIYYPFVLNLRSATRLVITIAHQRFPLIPRSLISYRKVQFPPCSVSNRALELTQSGCEFSCTRCREPNF